IEAELMDGKNDSAAVGSKLKIVEQLIREEPDQTVQAMAKRHADAIAQRLNISDKDTLRVVERAIDRATAPSPNSGVPQVAAPDRARSRARARDIRLEMVGSILDFPALLDQDDAAEVVGLLEGDAALVIAAMRQDPTLLGAPEHLLAK